LERGFELKRKGEVGYEASSKLCTVLFALFVVPRWSRPLNGPSSPKVELKERWEPLGWNGLEQRRTQR